MTKLISQTEHEYPYGTKRTKGEAFDADDAHVDILVRLGRARRADEDEAEVVDEIQPRGRSGLRRGHRNLN